MTCGPSEVFHGDQRRGLGRRLVKEAVDRLIANGLTSMALFTERDNEPACAFYDSLGGERQLDEKGQFGGMYGWRDLRDLQRRLGIDGGGGR